MKKIMIVMAALLFATISVAAGKNPKHAEYDFKITRVIDGDTVAFEAPFLPAPLKQELSIRVFGVDTPEKGFRAACPAEAERGESASAFTKEKIKHAKKIQVSIMDWDKYGGRVLGDIIIDGVSLRKMLIDHGYAREYYGDKKESWCTIAPSMLK
jgi:endonuclease YncB( thermonuclease family)